MNREQSIRYKDRHLQYQYDLCHFLPSTLSGLYVKKLYNSSKKYQVALPNEITDSNVKFCGNCGIVRVINKTVKINKIVNDGIGTLKYHCLSCKYNYNFDLGRQPVVNKSMKDDKNEILNNDSKLSEKKIQKRNNSAKARSKKRKMNSLSNLLSKKNEERSKSNSSLSLDSFMQR